MRDHRSALETEASRWTHESSADLSGDGPSEQTQALIHRVFETFLAALLEGEQAPLEAFIHHVIELRGGMLFQVSTPQRGFFSFRKVVQGALRRAGAPELQALRLLVAIDDLYVASMYTLADGFSAKKSKRVESLYEEAKRANQAKERFLASMSHELRTPLNAIMGTCEALVEGTYGELNTPQTRVLETAHTSGRHLLSLVNDLLDLSKIEADAFEAVLKPMSLVTVCTEVIQVMRPIVSQAGLKLSLSFDGEVDEVVSDERCIRQILLNLLGNALKFTRPGGRISLSLERRGQGALISIEDTGVGIAASELSRIFEAFTQTDASANLGVSGTGLGLHLTRRLAHALGATVEVESELGVGSCFHLTLPLVAEAQERAPATSSRASLAERAGSASPTSSSPPERSRASEGLDVLLVDDTPGNIGHVRDFLVTKGHRVSVATNGVEAIEQAQELPDVILMDIQMPVMDGLEATRRLRADSKTEGLYIVALTSYAMGEDEARCLAAGVDLYESKPISLKRLLEIVEERREQT